MDPVLNKNNCLSVNNACTHHHKGSTQNMFMAGNRCLSISVLSSITCDSNILTMQRRRKDQLFNRL